MEENKASVRLVLAGSIAEEAGIEVGDRITSINGKKVGDILDYRFLITDENIVLEILKEDGDIWETEIEKDEYEDLGIEFEDPMMDGIKRCRNKCIFCFIDQMPPGMRETLYLKDDDSRLSFLSGNYVTLTNMGKEDLERVIRYKMSPVNISVHTTNPELRKYMLNNRLAGDVLEKIKFLTDGGITVNSQIVLCRGVNDGIELDDSIKNLASLYPRVNSISVVPVGITRFRKGLPDLVAYDKDSSSEVIRQVKGWQKRLLEEQGSRVAFPADEFFVMAEMPIPDYEEYEEFPQIENGVGLLASLKHEFCNYLNRSGGNGIPGGFREISIATGESSYLFIEELISILIKRYDNIKVNVFKIRNEFFGETVTVTGLLTGRDIIAQLSGKPLGSELLISKSMLKSGEETFLDDITVPMVEERLKVRVTAVDNSGRDFIKGVRGKG